MTWLLTLHRQTGKSRNRTKSSRSDELKQAGSKNNAGQHLNNKDRPHDHEHQSRDGEERAAQPNDVAGYMNVGLQHAKEDKHPSEHYKNQVGVLRHQGENG